MHIPTETLWYIMQFTTARFLVLVARLVCVEWKRLVDRVTQQEWRHFYRINVCELYFLPVRSSFDWRRAAVRAAVDRPWVCAVCVWNLKRVRIESPWTCAAPGCVDVALREGVVRYEANIWAIDFVYDGVFRLRGRVSTCRHRRESVWCVNCIHPRSKQRCLNLKYMYYIREHAECEETHRNECILLHTVQCHR